MNALVHLRENEGAGGRGKSTTLELALATSLRGVLYSDNAGDVSQSPEQPMKMIGGIVVVCTKEMAEPVAIFNIEAAGQVCSRTNEFVYLGGDINQRTRRILSAGFVAHMNVTRLPKCVMFGELGGGRGL